ncbi:hypothetical protein F4556_005925 [Kitasatospora gansuensis]|uniref:Uncharacterized protein n=1 Tax=Kitasatospora gansuensis TaxID=258050 RepID=A0A7W7SH42_9ACTN|nr:hypothetical protein [Kitasatospora gansuensis]MBB4950390.1 hypothetical protein [Kitasatospora gansuensis]
MKLRQLFSVLFAALLMTVAAPGPAQAAGIPPGPYVSPWGTAQVEWAPSFKARLAEQAVAVTPIAPVTLLPDDRGIISDIGSTSGDYIDLENFGRVYYPGGVTLTNPQTSGSWTMDEFWLRFWPDRGLSSELVVNGVKSPTEQLFCSYTLRDAFGVGWGLTFGGIKTAKVPLTLTEVGADTLNDALGTSFQAGEPFGVLSGTFRYIP